MLEWSVKVSWFVDDRGIEEVARTQGDDRGIEEVSLVRG
jgi:hypothetical protein